MAMLGLAWGTGQAEVRRHLAPLTPVEADPTTLIFPLAPVAERLVSAGAFCPTALNTGSERGGDMLILSFIEDALVAGLVRFGYAFETIGQASDTLSEMAMAAFARAELQLLVLEMAGRYGAPVLFTEAFMRREKWHPVGAALFEAEDGALVQVLFGHDGGALTGEIRHQGPVAGRGGF